MPTIKSVATSDGQVSNSQGDIFLYGASSISNQIEVTVSHIFLFNTSATTQTIDVFIKPLNGTSRQIRQVILAQNESDDIVGGSNPIRLSPGGAIRAVTTTDAVVDYSIAAEILS